MTLPETLTALAPKFEFYQLVRLLQLAADDRPLLGRAPSPRGDSVRFASNVSYEFAPSDVHALLEPRADGEPPTVSINFLGLANPGTKGSLPGWYSRTLREEAAAGNTAPKDFVDLFNHRFTTLYFLAWLRHNLPVQVELDPQGPLVRVLHALLGLGTKGLCERLAVDPRTLIANAAVASRRPPSADGLALALHAHFGVPVAVEPFQPSIQPLDAGEQTALDGTRGLGVDAVVGTSVLLTQGKFRLRLGPMDWERFTTFLPGGERMRGLQSLVRTLVGLEFDYDVRLILAEGEVPTLRLGSTFADRARLGWSTWLGVRLAGGHADQTLVPASDLEATTLTA